MSFHPRKQNLMGCNTEQPDLVYPTGFGQDDLQRCFPSSAMLWFCEETDKVDAH